MSLELVAIVTTFLVIFTAELPDKSMFASVVLATRFRPLPVWLGLATAFLAHGIIAVTAGHFVTLLPHRIVSAAVTVLFLIGAALMFFSKDDAPVEGEEVADDAGGQARSDRKVFATAFAVIFISEWGDLTQIAAITLTARYESPLSVLIGTVAALWLVCGLGVLLGKKLVQAVPLRTVKRVAGTVLLALAVWSAIDLIKG